jgi:hypothetical protein
MSDPPRRWRLSWLGVAAVGLVLAVFLAVLWMTSRGDLDAVEARGRAMGIEPTWAAAGATVSAQPVLDAWKRLHQLATSLKSYADSGSTYGTVVKPGVPLSVELIRHHAALPAAQLAELDALCDGFTPDSVTDRLDFDILSPMDTLTSGRLLSRLMSERTALARPEDAATLLRRHLAAITAERPRTLIQGLVANSRLAIWQQAATYHLASSGLERETVAALADQARLWLDVRSEDMWCGEYRFMHTTAIQIAAGDPRYARGLLPQLGAPDWLDGHGLHRPLMRLARRSVLDFSLDVITAWRSHPDPAARLVAMQAMDAEVAALPAWNPRCRLLRTLAPATALVSTSWAKTDTGLRVLAAELRGTPWPVDPTDPAGGRVRRIERDGQLIGYYLLNSNGIDDGGRIGTDACVSLYEPLGNPKASDPVKSGSP